MEVKYLFLGNLRRTDSLRILVSDLCKSVAPCETRFCTNIIYLQLLVNFSNKNTTRETILVVTFSLNHSQHVISLAYCLSMYCNSKGLITWARWPMSDSCLVL